MDFYRRIASDDERFQFLEWLLTGTPRTMVQILQRDPGVASKLASWVNMRPQVRCLGLTVLNRVPPHAVSQSHD